MLQLLVTSSPRVISRNQILDSLWGEDKLAANQRTIDNMVVRLRQMLGDTESTKVGVGEDPGQLLTKLAALRVPIPVAKSHPVVAG